jgi:prepilin-type N-terminal cleavage/methylation domain-containing protein
MKPSSAKFRKRAFQLVSPYLSNAVKNESGQAGFSLVEVTIAMVVFLIAILGVFFSFTFAVNYNAGNSSRAQALAILQQKVEQMRSLKFVPTSTDAALTGGTKSPEIVTAPDGNRFRIQVIVDDDPFTADIQTNAATKFKEINVTVTLERPTPGWQTSVPATIILRRVRGN